MSLSFSCVFGGQTDEPIHQSDQQVNEDEVMAGLLQAFTNDDWEGIGDISELTLPVVPPAPAKQPCCQNDHLQPSPVLTLEDSVTEIEFTFDVTPATTPEKTHVSISSEEPELIFSSTGSSSPDDQRPDAVAQPVPQRPQECQTYDIHPMHSFQSTQGAQQITPMQPMHQRQNIQRAYSLPATQPIDQVRPIQRAHSMPSIESVQSFQPIHSAQFTPSIQPPHPLFPAYQGAPFFQVQPMYQNPPMYNIQSKQQNPPMQQVQPVYNTQFMYPPPMYFTQPVYPVQPMYNTLPKQARPFPANSPKKPTEKPSKKRIIEFAEPTVPTGFVANPNNHGRWEIDRTGNKHYLNAPKVKKQRA